MGFDPHEPQQQRMLTAAMKSARIGVGELWLKYFSLGGEVGEYEVEAYLQGLLSLPILQRDLLAMAANELMENIPQRRRAPYSDELGRDGGSSPNTQQPPHPEQLSGDGRSRQNPRQESKQDPGPGPFQLPDQPPETP